MATYHRRAPLLFMCDLINMRIELTDRTGLSFVQVDVNEEMKVNDLLDHIGARFFGAKVIVAQGEKLHPDKTVGEYETRFNKPAIVMPIKRDKQVVVVVSSHVDLDKGTGNHQKVNFGQTYKDLGKNESCTAAYVWNNPEQKWSPVGLEDRIGVGGLTASFEVVKLIIPRFRRQVNFFKVRVTKLEEYINLVKMLNDKLELEFPFEPLKEEHIHPPSPGDTEVHSILETSMQTLQGIYKYVKNINNKQAKSWVCALMAFGLRLQLKMVEYC